MDSSKNVEMLELMNKIIEGGVEAGTHFSQFHCFFMSSILNSKEYVGVVKERERKKSKGINTFQPWC